MKNPKTSEVEHLIELFKMLDENDKYVATVMMEQLSKRSIHHRIVNHDGNIIKVNFG